jgi:hypothetical protein
MHLDVFSIHILHADVDFDQIHLTSFVLAVQAAEALVHLNQIC